MMLDFYHIVKSIYSQAHIVQKEDKNRESLRGTWNNRKSFVGSTEGSERAKKRAKKIKMKFKIYLMLLKIIWKKKRKYHECCFFSGSPCEQWWWNSRKKVSCYCCCLLIGSTARHKKFQVSFIFFVCLPLRRALKPKGIYWMLRETMRGKFFVI